MAVSPLRPSGCARPSGCRLRNLRNFQVLENEEAPQVGLEPTTLRLTVTLEFRGQLVDSTNLTSHRAGHHGGQVRQLFLWKQIILHQ